MHTGREDYEGALKTRAIPENEPVLIFRAQDMAAADTGRFWAGRILALGGPGALVEQLLQQVDRIEAWPVKKLPSADHIADPAPLEAAFAQRLWTSTPRGDRQALDLEYARGRADGFSAGVRSEGQAAARDRVRLRTLEGEVATLTAQLRAQLAAGTAAP